MRVTISHTESSFNRATRKRESREITEGFANIDSATSRALRACAQDYRLTVAEMVELALRFYFGDGCNHFNCEHCDYWKGECKFPKEGEQTTVPLFN